MSLGKVVMIFGLGELGAWVLHFLAREEGASTIIACDKRGDFGALLADYVAASAGHLGYCKTIKFERCDVLDVDATAELINKYNPDLIYSSMVLLSATWPMRLPPDIYAETGRIMATQLPGHFVLPYKLMQAVKKSGSTAACIQNSEPDTINPILNACGLGVLTGAGNISNIVAEIRRVVSVVENVPIRDVTVYGVWEHYVGVEGTRTGLPYFIKVMIGDKDITKDVTKKCGVDSLLEARIGKRIHRPSTVELAPAAWTHWGIMANSASSAVRVLTSILNDANEFDHVPGPNGLIGGYPVRISAKGVKIELPEGLTMDEAIKINTEAAKREGVEEIKDDGTLVVTDEAYEITKRIFGIECKEIHPEDMEDRARELITAFQKLGDKYGFTVPTY